MFLLDPRITSTSAPTGVGWGLDTSHPADHSPMSSPKAHSSARTSLDGHEHTPGKNHGPSSSSSSSRLPGWATPPKSPKSPRRSSLSPMSSPTGNRRSSGNFGSAFSPGGNTGDTHTFNSNSIPGGGGSGTSTPSRRDSRGEGVDRYIPHRSHLDIDLAAHLLGANENDDRTLKEAADGTTTAKLTLVGAATRTHLGVISNANNVGTANGSRLLSCFGQSSKSAADNQYVQDDGFSRLKYEKVSESYSTTCSTTNSVGLGNSSSPTGRHATRYIPTQPSRILDAPDLMDDYYLNLLSWGSNNVIAVALNQAVYLWHAADGHIDPLLTLDGEDYVTSVQWSGTGDNTLAVGTSSNTVQLWDASALTKVRDLTGHSSRVSSLSWNGSNNPNLLSSGSRDATILNHDIRASRNVQDTLCGHNQEICGLSWSPDGTTLASGGNENRLCIWDAAMSRATAGTSTSTIPRFSIDQHNAAVKAVSWCSWQRNVLASGGGTADRTIRIWNTSTGNNLRTIDTGSQVCAIQWSQTEKELVSSHGFRYVIYVVCVVSGTMFFTMLLSIPSLPPVPNAFLLLPQ